MRSRLKPHASRIVAVCRIALTLALVLTSGLAPALPLQAVSAALAGLAAYLLFSTIMLVIAWRHWWLNHRLRHAGFAVDVVVSFVTLYWMEGTGRGLVSPFMVFYIYLLITATLLWRSRGAAIAMLLIVAGYIATGLLIQSQGAAWEPGWFGRRLAFMVVIGGLIIWYGMQRARHVPDRLDWPLEASVEQQIDIVHAYIRRHIRCTGIAVAWTPDEEPWTHVSMDGDCGSGHVRLTPETFAWDDEPPGGAMLFDRTRRRGLLMADADSIVATRNLPPCQLASYLSVSKGITVPIQSQTGRGNILLTGIHGVSGDHLRPAYALSEEIGYALDRHQMAWMLRDAATARVRNAVARDLHDSVAQSLAGASFRLEALRQAALSGNDIISELAAVQQSLAREELIVQGLIGQLRQSESTSNAQPAMMGLDTALADIADHWGVAAQFETALGIAPLPARMELELQQLVREAVANAVRHGEADQVALALRRDGDCLKIDFTDNGKGFAAGDTAALPRSILGRVTAMGGTLQLASRPGHTSLSILLPLDPRR